MVSSQKFSFWYCTLCCTCITNVLYRRFQSLLSSALISPSFYFLHFVTERDGIRIVPLAIGESILFLFTILSPVLIPCTTPLFLHLLDSGTVLIVHCVLSPLFSVQTSSYLFSWKSCLVLAIECYLHVFLASVLNC